VKIVVQLWGAIITLCAITIAGACGVDGPAASGDAGDTHLGVLISDAGIYATVRTPHAVSSPSGGGMCSSPANVSCGIAKFEADEAGPSVEGGIVDTTASFVGYDLSCVSDVAACSGELNEACDGPEDCQGGESCCLTEGGSWYFKTACRPTCAPIGYEAPGVLGQLCHDHTDCPSDFSACCVSNVPDAPPAPFGFCIASSTVKPGTSASCDVP